MAKRESGAGNGSGAPNRKRKVDEVDLRYLREENARKKREGPGPDDVMENAVRKSLGNEWDDIPEDRFLGKADWSQH